jgi:hypothetical protein
MDEWMGQSRQRNTRNFFVQAAKKAQLLARHLSQLLQKPFFQTAVKHQ